MNQQAAIALTNHIKAQRLSNEVDFIPRPERRGAVWIVVLRGRGNTEMWSEEEWAQQFEHSLVQPKQEKNE